MRTTVSISPEILEAAKALARQRGTTLGKVVDDALRRELATPVSAGARPPVPVFDRGTGAVPGVELDSNRALSALLDEDQPLNRLR